MYNPEAAIVYDTAIQLMKICGHFKWKQTCADLYLSFVYICIAVGDSRRRGVRYH